MPILVTIKIQTELKSSNFSSERFPLIQSRCAFPWIKREIKDEVTFAADTTKLSGDIKLPDMIIYYQLVSVYFTITYTDIQKLSKMFGVCAFKSDQNNYSSTWITD